MMQTENRTAVIRERIENIYKYLHRHKEYINRLNVFLFRMAIPALI